jgi:ribosomal protein L11 methyltransferase
LHFPFPWLSFRAILPEAEMNQWYQIALPKDSSTDRFIEIEGFLGSEEKENAVILYFEKSEKVREQLKEYNISIISDGDWKETWREYFVPVKIGSLTVVPPWKKDEGDIIINPARGFGTGHHETTRLALEFVEKVLKKDNTISTIFDAGTGSGILAIAAVRLKSSVRATAVDNDADAIENAAENLILNNVQDSITLSSEPVFKFEGKYDLVIANIISSVLYFLSDDLKRLTSKWLILSGVLESEAPVFMQRMGLAGEFELIEKTNENEWSGYLLKRRDK